MLPPCLQAAHPANDLPAPLPARLPFTAEIRLDAVGFDPAERPALCSLLDEMGRRLGLRLTCGGSQAEVLLLEVGHALRLPAELVRTLRADRPTLLMMGQGLRGGPPDEREREALLHQLRELAPVRARLPAP